MLIGSTYIIAAASQFPLSLIAPGGAIVLLISALSWTIFGFIAGMFIIVQALESTGLTTKFGQLLLHLSGGTTFGAVLTGTLGSALGTNLINNVSMAVVLTSSLQSIQHTTLAGQHGFIAGTIFGSDLRPNLTTVGSLATVL